MKFVKIRNHVETLLSLINDRVLLQMCIPQLLILFSHLKFRTMKMSFGRNGVHDFMQILCDKLFGWVNRVKE